MGDFGTRGYANDFTAKVFIEVVDDYSDEELDNMEDYEDDNSEFDKAIDEVFTNKGPDQKRVLKRSRGINTEPAFVHEFKGNTDHEFHLFMSELTEKQIYKNTGWHPLLSVSTSGKLGVSTEFKQILRLKYNTTLRRRRRRLSNVADLICEEVAEFLGGEGIEITKNYSITTMNIFKDMLKEDPTEGGQKEPAIEKEEGNEAGKEKIETGKEAKK